MAQRTLSAKSGAILSLIAEGHSYEQIVGGQDDMTYIDIFNAAKEALELCDGGEDYRRRMRRIKEKHPRAYEPWTDEEEARAKSMHSSGNSVADIARELQRQPSAVRSRIAKHIDRAGQGSESNTRKNSAELDLGIGRSG